MAQANPAQRVAGPQQLAEKLAEPGVKVVEAFSEWAGPCACIAPTFRALRMANTDAGREDDALQFLTVCAEHGGPVAEVTGHNGRSEPLFLLYKNGVLGHKVEGADPEAVSKAALQLLGAAGGDDPADNPFRSPPKSGR